MNNMSKVFAKLKSAVKTYLSGDDASDPDSAEIEIVEDSRIDGAWAIRVKTGENQYVCMLITEHPVSRVLKSDLHDLSSAIEEVEYKTWPPRSKS